MMTKLHNRYFVLRHGESEANVQQSIVSDPKVGTRAFGLTPTGRRQVSKSISQSPLRQVAGIYSSDFLRAHQSAEIASESLSCGSLETSPLLRERCFGSLEGKSNVHYDTVWRQDRLDPTHESNRVESVRSVQTRMLALLERAEAAHSGHTILIVSHGDPLQILLATVQGIDPRDHRTLPALATGELRPIR